MATWGKKQARIDKYDPPSTMYYEYNTTVDAYYIKAVVNDDHGLGNETSEIEYRFGNRLGTCLMEAFIAHVLSFEYSDDTESFIKEHVTNNRFKK